MRRKGFKKVSNANAILEDINKSMKLIKGQDLYRSKDFDSIEISKRSKYITDGISVDIQKALDVVADKYNISKNPNDYIFIVAIACHANKPNDNGDAFSDSELTRYDPILGMRVYESFRLKPHFIEHKSSDVTQAKGFILDAHYNEDDPDDKFVELVIAVDKTKDPEYARAVEQGKIKTFSMGCSASATKCSICGNVAISNFDFCEHIQKKTSIKEVNGKRVFEWCLGVVFDEISAVADPADTGALLQEKLGKVARKDKKTAQIGEIVVDLEGNRGKVIDFDFAHGLYLVYWFETGNTSWLKEGEFEVVASKGIKTVGAKKFYVGYPEDKTKRPEIFESDKVPEKEDYPQYGFVEGPFDTYEEAENRVRWMSGTKKKSGLESRVDSVIEEANPGLRAVYYWEDGMNIKDESKVNEIIKILESSGEFGPVRYNKNNKKIEIGVTKDWWTPSDGGDSYEDYVKKFKNFELGARKLIKSKIVKKDDGYYVLSEEGKNLGGPYSTKEEAEERLKQVEMFKHMEKKQGDKNDWVNVSVSEDILFKTLVDEIEDKGFKNPEEYARKLIEEAKTTGEIIEFGADPSVGIPPLAFRYEEGQFYWNKSGKNSKVYYRKKEDPLEEVVRDKLELGIPDDIIVEQVLEMPEFEPLGDKEDIEGMVRDIIKSLRRKGIGSKKADKIENIEEMVQRKLEVGVPEEDIIEEVQFTYPDVGADTIRGIIRSLSLGMSGGKNMKNYDKKSKTVKKGYYLDYRELKDKQSLRKWFEETYKERLELAEEMAGKDSEMYGVIWESFEEIFDIIDSIPDERFPLVEEGETEYALTEDMPSAFVEDGGIYTLAAEGKTELLEESLEDVIDWLEGIRDGRIKRKSSRVYNRFRLMRLERWLNKKGQWEELPRGWTRESLESFWDSVGGSVTKCMEKMKGKVTDEAAFCASLKDIIEGTTYWRGPESSRKTSSRWTRLSQTDEQEKSIELVERAVNLAGERIVGGTTIGKEPQTVILDLTYQGGEIYVNSEGRIEIFGEDMTDYDEESIADLIKEKMKEKRESKKIGKKWEVGDRVQLEYGETGTVIEVERDSLIIKLDTGEEIRMPMSRVMYLGESKKKLNKILGGEFMDIKKRPVRAEDKELTEEEKEKLEKEKLEREKKEEGKKAEGTPEEELDEAKEKLDEEKDKKVDKDEMGIESSRYRLKFSKLSKKTFIYDRKNRRIVGELDKDYRKKGWRFIDLWKAIKGARHYGDLIKTGVVTRFKSVVDNGIKDKAEVTRTPVGISQGLIEDKGEPRKTPSLSTQKITDNALFDKAGKKGVEELESKEFKNKTGEDKVAEERIKALREYYNKLAEEKAQKLAEEKAQKIIAEQVKVLADRWARSLKLALKRQSLNVDTRGLFKLKMKLADVLCNPSSMFAGMRPDVAVSLIESAFMDVSKEAAEEIVKSAQQLMELPDEAFIQIEADIDRIRPIDPLMVEIEKESSNVESELLKNNPVIEVKTGNRERIKEILKLCLPQVNLPVVK